MTPRSIFSRPAGSKNYFDPATRICWHIGYEWCRDDHRDQRYFYFGRCRSGQRWFWAVGDLRQISNDHPEYREGWEDSEDAAEAGVRAAIINWADGRPAAASLRHDFASHRLKELNKLKRQQRPPSDATDSKPVEYLYGHTRGGEDTPGHPVRFRIVKKTAKRIYYLQAEEEIDQYGEPVTSKYYIRSTDRDDQIGFVDRQKLEATGEVYNRGRHWCYSDFHLHASLQGLLGSFSRYQQDQNKPPDLRELKAAMAAAHPDRGGSSAAFIAAREKYLAALRASRKAV